VGVAAVAAGRRRDWRDALWGGLATASGKVTGHALRVRRMFPGVAGAAAVSVCAGGLAGHVFGHGLSPWVGGLVGGVFLLLVDRRL
jgi:hypothetical protein